MLYAYLYIYKSTKKKKKKNKKKRKKRHTKLNVRRAEREVWYECLHVAADQRTVHLTDGNSALSSGSNQAKAQFQTRCATAIREAPYRCSHPDRSWAPSEPEQLSLARVSSDTRVSPKPSAVSNKFELWATRMRIDFCLRASIRPLKATFLQRFKTKHAKKKFTTRGRRLNTLLDIWYYQARSCCIWSRYHENQTTYPYKNLFFKLFLL